LNILFVLYYAPVEAATVLWGVVCVLGELFDGFLSLFMKTAHAADIDLATKPEEARSFWSSLISSTRKTVTWFSGGCTKAFCWLGLMKNPAPLVPDPDLIFSTVPVSQHVGTLEPEERLYRLLQTSSSAVTPPVGSGVSPELNDSNDQTVFEVAVPSLPKGQLSAERQAKILACRESGFDNVPGFDRYLVTVLPKNPSGLDQPDSVVLFEHTERFMEQDAQL